jgi:hypothetical protein
VLIVATDRISAYDAILPTGVRVSITHLVSA